MATSGPNPVLAVRDHLSEYVSDLKEKRAKTIEKLTEINTELALAETLQAVVAPAKGPEDGR